MPKGQPDLGPVFLRDDTHLAVHPDGVVLARAGIPVEHALSVGEALALTFLGAFGCAEEAGAELGRCLPSGAAWVDRVVERYWTYLGPGTARALDEAWLRQVLAIRSPVPTLAGSSLRSEAAPKSVTWTVTLGCNRRCPYCFFAVFHHAAHDPESPADATFPLADAVRMVRDMGDIGAADLYLTGGEPLLRRDLPEIIAEASRARVRTHVVTKLAVGRELAERLARAGLSTLTVSLDDARPGAAAALAGAHGYLTEAEHTIEQSLAAGLSVEVNAVVTRKNVDQLDGLAAHLVSLGVPRLRVSPFTAPYPRRAAAERLLTEVDVAGAAADLRARLAGAIEIVLGSGAVADERSGRKCGAQTVCEVGTRALDVLPDGSVTRCHYLPGRPELVVGSLRSASLLDIWRDEALGRLSNPAPSAYEGTACAGCGSFQGCNARGRCYVSALESTGRMFAPDAFCGRAG